MLIFTASPVAFTSDVFNLLLSKKIKRNAITFFAFIQALSLVFPSVSVCLSVSLFVTQHKRTSFTMEHFLLVLSICSYVIVSSHICPAQNDGKIDKNRMWIGRNGRVKSKAKSTNQTNWQHKLVPMCHFDDSHPSFARCTNTWNAIFIFKLELMPNLS